MAARDKSFGGGVRTFFSQISQKVKRSSQSQVKGHDPGYEELPVAMVGGGGGGDQSDGFFSGDWEGGGSGRSSALFARYDGQGRNEGQSTQEGQSRYEGQSSHEGQSRNDGQIRNEGQSTHEGQRRNEGLGTNRTPGRGQGNIEVTRPRSRYLLGLENSTADVHAGRTSKGVLKQRERQSSSSNNDYNENHDNDKNDRQPASTRTPSERSFNHVETSSAASEGLRENDGVLVKERTGGMSSAAARECIMVGEDIYTLPDRSLNRPETVPQPKAVERVDNRSAQADTNEVEKDEKDEKDEKAVQESPTREAPGNEPTRPLTQSHHTLSTHSDSVSPVSSTNQTRFTLSLSDLESQQINPLYTPDDDDDDDDDDSAPNAVPPLPRRTVQRGRHAPVPHRERDDDKHNERDRHRADSAAGDVLSATNDVVPEEQEAAEEVVDDEAVEYVEHAQRTVAEEREQLRVISDLDSVLEDEDVGDDDDDLSPVPNPNLVHKNWSYASEKPGRRKFKDPDMMYQNWEVVKAEKQQREPVYENVKMRQQPAERSWPGADDTMLEELQRMHIQKLCNEKSGSVTLTDEYNPKRFLGETPTHDVSGMVIPAWKRHIMARQLAEKAMVDGETRKKREEEEARFMNMPPWKRALIEKKEAEFRSSQQHYEKSDSPEKSSSSGRSGTSSSSSQHGPISHRF